MKTPRPGFGWRSAGVYALCAAVWAIFAVAVARLAGCG